MDADLRQVLQVDLLQTELGFLAPQVVLVQVAFDFSQVLVVYLGLVSRGPYNSLRPANTDINLFLALLHAAHSHAPGHCPTLPVQRLVRFLLP